MKTRLGFVSNSSSSSFLAVGVSLSSSHGRKGINYFQDIVDKLGYDPHNDDHYLNFGVFEMGEFSLYGSDNDPWFVGIDASKHMYTMNGREMIMLFKKKAKELLGIDIPEEDIVIEFGEVCSG